jgi:uncharacterized protein (DUF58 family)
VSAPRPYGSTAPALRGGAAELFDEQFQKRLEVLALISRRVFAGRTRAERRTRKDGAGIEFADYRAYYAGDDYRQIDWNVYGRIERLMLRLHEQEEDLSVYLLLDCSGSMAFGSPRKLDYGKKLAAALAYVALNHLDRVSLIALRAADEIAAPANQRLAPTRGKSRIFSVFEFLRPLEASGPTRLADAIGTFVAQHKRRGVAVLISDLYDPAGFEEGVNRLRYARFEAHVIHVTDAADAAPRLRGDVELVDAETGESRPVTITPALARRYEQAYAAYLQRIASFCAQKKVGLFSLDTRTPPEEAMLRILRRGGLVA